MRLFESDDIQAIGAAANEIRRAMNGDRTYYVVNRHINYTDICKNRCAFCAYSRSEGEDGAYVMSVDEVVERASSYYEEMKFTELHIVGGLHPSLPFGYYTGMLSTLKSLFPGVHIQAFTAVEIAHIADVAGMSIGETLRELRGAGLGSMPGGGAEIFSPRVRAAVCPGEDAGRSVARGDARGARSRHKDQRDHALRPHRDIRGARQAHDRAERPAGLQPAGL